jgi:arylsulfatase A-like enzyme
MDKPANVIVLLLDSLNRHMLSAYGGTEFRTPNIDRLAARSLKFTTHYTGRIALHAGTSRHSLRRVGFSLASVGFG